MNLDESIEQLEKIVNEVRQASLADNLTVLGNKLALDQAGQLISAGESEFGDLNGFKKINDDYTHAAGDVAISKVGETINQIVVEGLDAKAFRPSGDEFVILLKQDTVERFLLTTSSFGNILFSYNEAELRTAMSLGYAVSDRKTSFSDLLERAEAACQNAKRRGDGVCIEWSEDIKLNPPVRLDGICRKCDAKISCNIAKQNAPKKLKYCPCCGGESLEQHSDSLIQPTEKETRKAKRRRAQS
jgi:diguanylate cyclase (GGDEF)-like protein